MNRTQRYFARFRFHGGLEALLRQPQDHDGIDCPFVDSPAIKDTIEAAGVPHTEVDRIYVNRRPVDFFYRLQAGDRVDIFPPDSQLPVEPRLPTPLSLCPAPPNPARFVLDVHLGKLARRLRLLGFDCLYRNDYDDAEVVALGCRDERIILTRDRGLLKQRRVRHGYLLRSDQPEAQLLEVLERFHLRDQVRPLCRCPVCNGLLDAVDKQAILHHLEPKTRQYYSEFARCRACAKLYWQGSHYDRITAWIDTLPETVAGQTGRH